MILHKAELIITLNTLCEAFFSPVTSVALIDATTLTVSAIPVVGRVTFDTDWMCVVDDTAVINLV